ncbi:ketoacyl-ACP synthase III family protein [Actinokineospora diospyrosa]|uniref:3-oxoacyl-[acyl-carrier-protein] synthase-3 n=1 Tax=Actinokineospora diospyrosa TaxID=103728 RepID=A0ABT1IIZ2_9PSEU|nr:ketoacyl-ACP synthase III family protein [Actinokineospora diospyrosa]MCP2272609.1 3-oxoacyl-[acyl-carrier-protein] synthase-3 [Actinokineospora diospyrosa]
MRIAGRVGVTAAVAHYPDTVEKAVDMVAAGRITEEDAAATGVEQLPVAEVPAPRLAVAAARTALARAGWDPTRIGLALHAWIYHQGHDFWSPAHYVAHESGATEALPMGVQQMCNGGAMAVEVAAARLLSDPATARALVTTGDRFAAPGFDRWKGDYGLWYGDAGTALLLHRADPVQRPGPLDLLSVTSLAAPALELMHRGADEFTPAPRAEVDVRRTKRDFLRSAGKEAFVDTVRAKVATVLRRGLDEAGVAADDPRVTTVLLPRLGATAARDIYGPVVGSVLGAPLVDPGTRTGHLGAGDVPASLADLLDSDRLAPGAIAVLLGAGGGFTWSCLVVRRTGEPISTERTER